MSNLKLPVAAVTASLLAISGAPLLAQEYSGAFSFGYSDSTVYVGGTKVAGQNALGFRGAVNVQFSDGFRMGARLMHGAVEYTGPDGSTMGEDNLRGAEVNFGYTMANGAWFGVYYEDYGPVGPLGPSSSHYTYGIEGGTNFRGVDVHGFIGTGDDVTSYGVGGQYATDRFTVGGSFIRSEPSDSSMSGWMNNIGVAGAYQINQQFGVFAGANRATSNSSSGNFNTYGLGVSYDLSGLVRLPLVASIEYVGWRVDDEKSDGFSVGLTIPLGSNRSNVPMNSVAGHVLVPAHDAINQYSMMHQYRAGVP